MMVSLFELLALNQQIMMVPLFELLALNQQIMMVSLFEITRKTLLDLNAFILQKNAACLRLRIE